MRIKSIYLIFLSVLLIDSGQLILKYAIRQIGELSFQLDAIITTFFILFTTPLVLLALFMFAASSITWFIAISKADLSFAYPLLGMGYAIVAILSWLLFNDNMTSIRVIGLVFVFTGVFMMSRSEKNVNL